MQLSRLSCVYPVKNTCNLGYSFSLFSFNFFLLIFQKIKRSAKTRKFENPEVGDWIQNYGTESDVNIPVSKHAACRGCGSHFQCNHASLPGFLPVEIFEKVERQAKRFPGFQQHLCRRCHLALNYNFLVSVCVLFKSAIKLVVFSLT